MKRLWNSLWCHKRVGYVGLLGWRISSRHSGLWSECTKEGCLDYYNRPSLLGWVAIIVLAGLAVFLSSLGVPSGGPI